MTPQDILARLLHVQRDELRRIVDELKAYPPANCETLLRACRKLEADIDSAAWRLHDDRAEISCR